MFEKFKTLLFEVDNLLSHDIASLIDKTDTTTNSQVLV